MRVPYVWRGEQKKNTPEMINAYYLNAAVDDAQEEVERRNFPAKNS